MIFGAKPKRTLQILNYETDDSEDEYFSKQKLLEKKLNRLSRSKEVNDKMMLTSKEQPRNRYKNIVHKINTANYIVMSSFKDGSDALREQVALSFERMKASKNWHEITDNLK